MTHDTIDSIARALTAVPPRAVAPDVLASADADELTAALRRAVADLPANEQRARLAAAFAAMTPTPGTAPATADIEAELFGPAPMFTVSGGDAPRISTVTAGLLSLRPSSAVKAGVLVGIAVVALLAGVLAGTVTRDDAPGEQVAVPGSVTDPIPVLRPVAFGADVPSDEQVAAMLPPDPAAQIAAADAAAAADPEVFEEGGIDPADTAYVPDPDVDPYVVGYTDGSGGADDLPSQGDVLPADGPAVGEPRRTGPSGGSDGGPGDGGDAGSGSTGSADDGGDDPAAGLPTGDDDTEPGLVDLCASDEPIDGCEGVAGTVTLAIGEPFAFVSDPAVSTAFRSCVEDTNIDTDEFIIVIDANNFGSFTARYRVAGSGDDFTEVSGETDERWRESFRPDFRYTNICLIGQRPTLDATQLELEVTGVGADDSGTAHFSGIVGLPETAGARRRDGRPDVRVTAHSASRFDVFVPIGDDERAEVTVVNRGEDGSIDCRGRAIAEGEPVTTVGVPGDILIHSDWHDQLFRLTIEDPGHLAICVRWTDTFDPPNELERASITLDVPTVTTTSVVLARYDQNGCLGGGCPSTPLAVWGAAEVGGAWTCNGRLNRGGYVPDEPLRLCHIGGLPQRVRLHTYAGFTTSGDGIRLDGVRETVAVDLPTCEETSCTTWYSVPVRAPGGLFEGNGGVVGRALFGITVDGGTAGVTVGSELPVKVHDAGNPDFARLDFTRVHARVDPADPARSVIVDWAADRPVTVAASAEEAAGHTFGGCPVVEGSSPDAPATSGTIRLSGLCPGTRHFVNFTLQDETGHTTVYDALRPTSIPGADWVQAAASVTTEPLTVTFDYDLTFTEFQRNTSRELTGLGVVPTELRVTAAGHPVVDFRQYYYGEPYVELSCAEIGHYDRSGSATVQVSGSSFGPVGGNVQVQTYRPQARGVFDTFNTGDRVCPSLYNQVNHTPTRRDVTCFLTLRNFVPERIDPARSTLTSDNLEHLLNGGVATFVARGNSSCRADHLATTFEARLTVRIRP